MLRKPSNSRYLLKLLRHPFDATATALADDSVSFENGDDETSIQPLPEVKHLRLQLLAIIAWIVSFAGTAAILMSGVLFLFQTLRVSLGFIGLTTEPFSILCLTGWTIVAIAVAMATMPFLIRSLRVRVRRNKARRKPQWLEMKSISEQLRTLRGVIVLFTIVVVGNSMAHEILERMDLTSKSQIISQWSNLLSTIACFFFLLMAGFVWWIVPRLYLGLRQQRIHASLRFHHRGVALRSFISEWDNTTRPIYKSCRLSARIAKAHRCIFLVTACCLSAAGSCMAMISNEWYLDEFVTVIVLGLLLAMWPMPERLVDWSGMLLDRFCDDPDDYDFV